MNNDLENKPLKNTGDELRKQLGNIGENFLKDNFPDAFKDGESFAESNVRALHKLVAAGKLDLTGM